MKQSGRSLDLDLMFNSWIGLKAKNSEINLIGNKMVQ